MFGYEFDEYIKWEQKGIAHAFGHTHTCSFEAIFDAYHDYRNSQQWN